MVFLSKETEKLLLKCVENRQNYPNILREELVNASGSQQDQLLIIIKVLIEEGYLSSILWADNLPYAGRIEQKAFDYFEQKNIYIRAKLRQDQYFVVLDDECEELLKNIISKQEPFIVVNDDALKYKDRVLAVYETTKGKIWIIAESDNAIEYNIITVLFPDDY